MLIIIGLASCDKNNLYEDFDVLQTPVYTIAFKGNDPVYKITIYRDIPLISVWQNSLKISSQTRTGNIIYTEVGEYPKFTFVRHDSDSDSDVIYNVNSTEDGCTVTITIDDTPIIYDGVTLTSEIKYVTKELLIENNAKSESVEELDDKLESMISSGDLADDSVSE